ncbi:hypothetical protein [uncultured Aquitalea sp.]|uniref:hypothetical protein n=1 Tax=uncultured Aquitalea sp. TaxID=540272 RepID=UPI0025D2A391|nr:hypothetical protein [uncultured Aquitalea sp.]
MDNPRNWFHNAKCIHGFTPRKRGNRGWHHPFNALILLRIQKHPRNVGNTRGQNRGTETLAWQGFAGYIHGLVAFFDVCAWLVEMLAKSEMAAFG